MIIWGKFKKKLNNSQSAKILLFHTSPLNTDYQINNNIPNIGNIFFLTLFPVCVKKYHVLKYSKTKTPLNKQYMFFLCLDVSFFNQILRSI